MAGAILALGGELDDVLIDDLEVEQNIYHAKLRVRQNDQCVLVDTHPSDAIAMALIFDKPIFIADSVLAKLDGPR